MPDAPSPPPADSANLTPSTSGTSQHRGLWLQLIRRFSGEPDSDALLQALVAEARVVLDGDEAMVTRWDGRSESLVVAWRSAERPLEVPLIRVGVGATGQAVARRAPVVVNDYQATWGSRTPAGRQGVQAVVAVPLIHQGRVLGALSVNAFSPARRFTEDDVQVLELLAGLVAAKVDQVRALDRERALREVTSRLASDLDERQVLGLAVQHAARLLEAPYARVWLLTPEGDLVWAAGEGAGDVDDKSGRVARLPRQSVSGLVSQGTPLNLADAATHPNWQDTSFVRRTGLRAFLGAPLRRAGDCLGVIEVMRTGDRPFDAADEQLLVGLSNAVAVAVDNARLYQAARDQVAHLAQTDEALRVAKEFTEAVIANAGEGIVVYDQELRYVRWNPAMEQITGMAPAEVLGKRAPDLFPHLRQQGLLDLLRRALAGERAQSEDVLFEVPATGRRGWYRATYTPRRDQDGAVVGVIGIIRETTQSIEAERALREAQAQTQREDKLRALGQMASGVAHDLNQSLALVAGYADVARQAAEAEQPDLAVLREVLPVVVRAAMDGGETVKRLLTFARTPADWTQSERLDAEALLREVAQLTAPRWRDATQAEGRPVSLRVETEGEVLLEGHAPSLREALMNLVLNAVDALPRGGSVRLGARRRGDQVCLEVSDTGVGMTEEVQARVFEPFFTTKGERGTGLGLAMVHGIVQRHGGQVAVESVVGAGTTFTLALPAAKAGGTTGGAGAAESAVRGLRVLAVDDEPALARMVALMLQRHGHQVTTAHSAEAALALLEQAGAEAEQASAEQEPVGYDVVVSDLGMGEGLSGWDLAARVKRGWPGTRVVLATGWGSAIDPAEARARGVDAVVPKPYRAADLARSLAGPGAPHAGPSAPLASPHARA